MVEFTITKREFFLPTIFTLCSIIGWSGFYELGSFIGNLIYDCKLPIFLFLLNFYFWIIFLKRIQFNIDIEIKYVPRGNFV
jgi:hypothetical protein